ncbi:ATP-binding protein [Jidongwangia harbinensis]|uniref:ATP-binding protein n=1 Tax=Jidongwangia harbinensis TaxID=2878561 RepID=UPI001CDA4E57|nr:tetratricopeptide repeat protein [Jidongwangia harbinensis]MCA2211755.1 tetratricopeptide repeat protein [Jidongwangia harbinensis]
MPTSGEPESTFSVPPDPAPAGGLDDLVERLRLLKVWAGDPSYETIKERVNTAWTAQGRPAGELTRRTTIADCFRPGRRRINTDLVIAVVQALHDDTGYVGRWRQALRVVGGQAEAAAHVRVQDRLPPDLAGFTGRAGEIDRLRSAGRRGDAVVISAIEGMAGVGKTQLAVHTGHLLHREQPFERVLFVNLRGFHPDPAQPPADPAAVLDGFLRLLGVSGPQVPHDLADRVALYHQRLAGTRALIVLDNAASAEQVRPLLPATPGCLTLVTSRRSLDLPGATHLAVDVFTPDEASAFLARAVPEVPVGPDPGAADQIARRCGYLPLALSLVAGRMHSAPGWNLTDHADRLDERHRDRRLYTGVELALDLSYQRLPPEHGRLLRLLALHPGPDFDGYAAAALADTGVDAARDVLRHLHQDHLLQPATPGRFTFHDLVRAYAGNLAGDEDRPAERRSALARLFDHYLATASAAMDTLYPADAYLRPKISQHRLPMPDLTDPKDAREWLDAERITLIAVVAHTATSGWATLATQLSRVLFRYLDGGHHTDAVTVHGYAHQAARQNDDPNGAAHALTDLGVAYIQLGRTDAAIEHLEQAVELFRQTGDVTGLARVHNNLGMAAEQSGSFPDAGAHYRQAMVLHRQMGNRTGEAGALRNLGMIEGQLGHYEAATEAFTQVLPLVREIGHRNGEAGTLNGLGEVEMRSGRYGPAAEHLRESLDLFRELGQHLGEADTLESLGRLHTLLGRPAEAEEYFQQALAICRRSGYRAGEAAAINGLGEAARIAGDHTAAARHHATARTIAADTGVPAEQARAHAGLGHVHRALGDLPLARDHLQQALTHYTDLGMPEAEQIRTDLAGLDIGRPDR